MRLAALYDIHGNLPALEAVLEEARREGVDEIVVGGDVLPGPMPRETLRRLLSLDLPVHFIRGNGERVVRSESLGRPSSEVPETFREVIRWTAEQLAKEDLQLLDGWPETLHFDIAGLGAALFCHATPRNDLDIFTRQTPEDRLRPIFDGIGVPVVVCGHKHMQFDRRVGTVRVVNAGSVGMPFAQPPGAHWLLLGPDVKLRQTAYDLEAAAARIRATGFPQAETLAVRYVLQPPPEAEMLERYQAAELK
jgi:predicted phosphodiesterase